MPRIKIKPLSVNDCWQGRRYKTGDYTAYETLLLYKMLPKDIDIPEGRLCIKYVFGFSSASSDWDNPIKPLSDILQKKYNFNDKRIKRAVVDVVQVKKGEEFIDFEISKLDD